MHACKSSVANDIKTSRRAKRKKVLKVSFTPSEDVRE